MDKPATMDPVRRGTAAATLADEAAWPAPIHPPVSRTAGGTPYLKEPGVVLLSRPEVRLDGMRGFLDGFEASLGFGEYLADAPVPHPGARIVKAAGQTCYASWGPRRTKNADAKRYIDHLLESGHTSVIEHANYTVLLYGVSRSLTHEMVRHRHGSFSQISQRYVDGKVLRFVERPEFQQDEGLHALFESRIDRAAAEYEELARTLLRIRDEGDPSFRDLPRTDRRKAVQQAARGLLPNETEAVIVVTANALTWRHIFAQRCSPHAEPEIRNAMSRVQGLLRQTEPLLFS